MEANMELIKVKSSNVVAVGWEENKLYVQYPGGIYSYENVSKDLYEKLLNAESKGKFLNEEIKNKFKFMKVSK